MMPAALPKTKEGRIIVRRLSLDQQQLYAENRNTALVKWRQDGKAKLKEFQDAVDQQRKLKRDAKLAMRHGLKAGHVERVKLQSENELVVSVGGRRTLRPYKLASADRRQEMLDDVVRRIG